MSETYHPQHRLQHALVLAAMLGTLAYGADQITGGVDNIRRVATEMYDSAFGLKNLNFDDSTVAADTSTIGTSTAACINNDAFSTDRVYRTGEKPDTYMVTVQKIGQGTLNAAATEQCIFDTTGLHATVEVG